MNLEEFFDDDGPLDTISAIMILFFSTAWFLAFGLKLGIVLERMPDFLTFFGIFPADLSFGDNLALRGGGALALVPILVTLPWLLRTESPVQGRHQRQTVCLAVWLGFFIVHLKNGVLDGNAGGPTSLFNLYWLTTNGFFAVLHLKWIGRDLSRKLKLS
jgi:hypothetical protein